MYNTNQKRGSKGVAMIFMAIAIMGMALIMFNPRQKTTESTQTVAFADSTMSRTITAQQSYSNYIIRTVLVTVCIIMIIVVVANIYKRRNRSDLPATFDLRIMGKKYLSAKQYLVLLKFRGRLLLVGVTDSSFTLLSDVGENDDYLDDTPTTASSFSELVQKYSFRKDGSPESRES